MRIQYVTNGSFRTVSDVLGQTLVDRKIARDVTPKAPAAPILTPIEAEAADPEPRNVAGYTTRELRPATDSASELDRLRAECDQRGIKYHHRAGVARLRELVKG